MATMWGEVDPLALRKTWADELRQFEQQDVRWALEQLRHTHQSYPPTLFEFAQLCRDGRRKRTPNPYLSAPKNPPSPEVMANVRSLVAKLKGRAA